MNSNHDIEFNLKANTSQLKQQLGELDKVGGGAGAGGTGGGAMGGKLFDKQSMGDPGAEAQKFIDIFGKKMEGLKYDKRLDIIGGMLDQMNSPGASMQTKAKLQKRVESLLNDLDVVWRNTQRIFTDKGGKEGISPEGVLKGMIHSVGGSAAEMYLNAKDISARMSAWDTGGGSGDKNNILLGDRSNPMNPNGDAISKYARKAAGYLIGYMVADAIGNAGQMYQSMMRAEANIFQRAGTTFDMGSVMQTGLMTSAMHRENIMQGLEIRNQGYSVAGQLGGLGIGLGVGLLTAGMTGGLSLGIAPMIGSRLGGEIGGIYGTQDITDEMRKQTEFIAKDKMVGQLMGIASQRVGIYDEMDTVRARFRARTRTSDIGGTGTGYTDAELYGLGTQQAGVTGYFNKQTFTDQLRFSRAFGYNPSEIFSAGVSTRYTGQNVGASELFARKELAERTGMGSRLPELIQALNQLTGIMTKVGANVSESSMMQAANLPFLLFGNTARGRMGDQGMDTLMGINAMFNQESGSAGDAYLYQALKPRSLQEFDIMKEKGVFGEGNLRKVIEYTGQFGGSGLQERLFKGLGIGSASLRKAITDQAFYQEDGIGTDGTAHKKGEVNKDFLAKFESIDVNTSEGTKQMAALLNVSEEAISDAEKHKKDMVDTMVKTGEKIAKSVHEMQIKEVQSQNAVLENQAVWNIVTETFKKAVFDFQQAVNKILGIDEKNNRAAIDDFTWNMFQNDKPGNLRKQTLDKLKLTKADIEEYSISAAEHIRDPNSLYIELDDPDRHDRDKSSKYYGHVFRKRLKISADRLKELGITEEPKKLQEELDKIAQEKHLESRELFPESPSTVVPGMHPEAQGHKGTTIVFNINAATRAGIHAELDNHLDSLVQMAHPTKLANNF